MIKELKREAYFKKLDRWLPSDFRMRRDGVLYVGYQCPDGCYKDDTYMLVGVGTMSEIRNISLIDEFDYFIEDGYKFYLSLKHIPKDIYQRCLSESEKSLLLSTRSGIIKDSKFYWEKHRTIKVKTGNHIDAGYRFKAKKEGWFRLNDSDMTIINAQQLLSELIHSRCEDYIRNIISPYLFEQEL